MYPDTGIQLADGGTEMPMNRRVYLKRYCDIYTRLTVTFTLL